MCMEYAEIVNFKYDKRQGNRTEKTVKGLTVSRPVGPFFLYDFLDETRHIFCYNGTMHFTQKIFTVVR